MYGVERAVEHEAIPSVAQQASLHVTAEFDQTGDPDDPPMRVAIGPSASRCSHGSLGQLKHEEEKPTADWLHCI